MLAETKNYCTENFDISCWVRVTFVNYINVDLYTQSKKEYVINKWKKNVDKKLTNWDCQKQLRTR